LEELALTAYVLVMAFCFGAYNWYLHRAMSLLKSRHPAVWESVGKPQYADALGSPLKLPTTLLTGRKWLWSPEAQALGDPDILRYGRLARIYMLTGVGLMLFFAAVFIYATWRAA